MSLLNKAFNGIIWNSVHRFGALFIAFISNIVLARLLDPSDFGSIGMLMVFIGISNTFVDGGFATALIQKKDPTKADYSTVFYWNFCLAIVLYLTLYFVSPFVAYFYEIETLDTLLRVLGFVLLINALSIIQNNILIKNMKFKKLASINILSSFFGTGLAIFMAYNGFGVWSLVAKFLVIAFFQCVLLWISSNWRPDFVFSKRSFKSLFSFGSLILLSNLSESIVFHFQALLIGKVFSVRELGLYTQAKRMHEIPERSIPQIVDQVVFPIYSAIQDDKNRVSNAFQKSIRILSYVNFPIMVLLICISKPVFEILLTSKWNDSVIYFQILCLGGMLFSINSNNVNVVKSLGKSNFILFMTLIKRIPTIAFILIGLKFGVVGVVTGYMISMYIWFPINAYYTGKLIPFGFWKQLKSIFAIYCNSIFTGIITYFLINQLNINNNYLLIVFSIILYFTVYITFSHLLKVDSQKIVYDLVKKKLGSQ